MIKSDTPTSPVNRTIIEHTESLQVKVMANIVSAPKMPSLYIRTIPLVVASKGRFVRPSC